MTSFEAELGKLHHRLKDSVSVISQCLVHTHAYLASQDSHALRRQKELRIALEKDKARWDDFARYAVGLSAAALEAQTGEQRAELAGDWGQVTRLLATTQRKLGQRLQGSEGLLWEEFAELNKELWECFCKATTRSTETKLKDVIRQQEQHIGNLQDSLRTNTKQTTMVRSAHLSPQHSLTPTLSESATHTGHRHVESAHEALEGHRRPEFGSLRKELEDLVRQRDEVRAIVSSKGSSPLRSTGPQDLLRLEKERSQAFYKALKEKEKDCRLLHVSCASLQTLQQELADLRNQEKSTQMELSSARVEMAGLQREVEMLKREKELWNRQAKEGSLELDEENKREKQELEAKLRKLKSDFERMQQEKEEITHESRILKENLQEKQGKIENLSKILEEMHNSYIRNRQNLDLTKEKLSLHVKTASDSHTQLFNRLTESVFLLEKKLKTMKTLLSAKRQLLTASNTHKSQLKTQFSDLMSRYTQEKDAFERVILSQKAEISTFQSNLHDSESKSRAEIQTLKGDLSQLRAKYEELTKVHTELKQKARSDLTSSELRVEEKDHSVATLQAALLEKQRELRGKEEAGEQLETLRRELASEKTFSLSQAREIANLQGKVEGLKEELAASQAIQSTQSQVLQSQLSAVSLHHAEETAQSSKQLEELLDIQEALTQKLNSTRAEAKARTVELSTVVQKSEREMHALGEKVREAEMKLGEEVEKVETLSRGKRQFEAILQALNVASGPLAIQAIAAMQGKAAEQAQAIVALEAQKTNLQTDLQRIQAEIVLNRPSNEQLLANLQRENATFEAQLETVHREVDSLTAELNTTQTANQALLSDLEKAKMTEYETLGTLSEVKSAYDQLLTDTHQSTTSLNDQIDRTKAELGRLQARNEALRTEKEAEISKLEGKLRDLREKIMALGGKTGSPQDSDSVIALLKAEMDSSEALRQSNTRLEQLLESVSNEQQQTQSRLTELLVQKEAELTRLREEVELLRIREQKLLEDLEIMRKSASDSQKESLLTVKRLEQQFKASELTSKQLLAEVNHEKDLIFAELEATKQFSASKIQEIAGNCVLLEEKNSAILRERDNLLREKKLLSEKAEIETNQLRMLAENAEKARIAVSKQLEETVASRNQEETSKLREIEAQIAHSSIEKRQFETKIADLTESLAASKEAIQTLSLQVASTGETTAQLKWKLSEAEGQYQAATDRAESLDQQLTAVVLDKAALSSSLQRTEEECRISKQHCASLMLELTQLREVGQNLTRETAKVDTQMQTLREENESLKMTLAAEQANARETATDLESFQDRLQASEAQWTQEKLKLEQQCTAWEEELEGERSSKLEAQTEARKLGEELAAERAKVERMASVETMLRETKAKLAQSEQEISDLLLKNANLTSEIALLEDKFTESSRLPLQPDVIMKPLTPHTPHSFSFHSSEDFGDLGEEADFPLIVTSKSMTGEVHKAVSELEKLFEVVDFEGCMNDIEQKIDNLVRKIAKSTDLLGIVKANIRKRKSESDTEDGPGAPQPSLQPHTICLGIQYEGKTWVLERTATDFAWKEHLIPLDPASVPLLLTEDQISHMHTLEVQLRQKTIQMDEAEELHLAKTQEFDKIKQLLTDRGFNFQGQSLLAVVQSAFVTRRPSAGSRGNSPVPKRLSGLSSEFSDLALGVEKESASPTKVLTLAVPKPELSNQSSDSMALSEAEASSLFSTIDKLRRENDDMSKHNDDLERQVTLLKQKLREREQSTSEPVSGSELSTVLQNLLEVLPLQ